MVLHVVTELSGAAQVLFADLAVVALGVMLVGVVGEFMGGPKALDAERTLEANCRVRGLVFLEDALLFKGLLADCALVRPHARVHALVTTQCAREGEAAAAVAARERLLARVDSHVLPQVNVLREALPTGAALERSFS